MKTLRLNNNKFDIFFSLLNNKIYFKETPICFFIKTLTRHSLLKISYKHNLHFQLQLWHKSRNFFFFKTIYTLYNSIYAQANYITIQDGFYVKLDLIGLGFRIQKISEKIFFFSLGWANGVYFFVPSHLRVFILSKKRQLVVFGFDLNKVYNIVSMLILLRKTRPYRITGFINPIFIQRLRSGKQR